MLQKSLISRLKRLTRTSTRPSVRTAGSVGKAHRVDDETLRILRPPEVGGSARVQSGGKGAAEMFDRTMDVVVKSALDSGILTVAELEPVARDGSLAVDWRTVSAALPDRANTLKRFAAGIYGFQPVVVSQVGTLVLADRLVGILPRDVWKKCFALDCIPVLPHGVSMSAAGHVTLASPDPARAAVRNLARSILSGRSILAYADQSTIDELKSFLPARLPAVSQAVQAMDADHSDSRSNAA